MSRECPPPSLPHSFFPSRPFFRPSSRSFNIVGKSCGAVVPAPGGAAGGGGCRMELLIVMKKTKGGRKIFVPPGRKEAGKPSGVGRKRDQKRRGREREAQRSFGASLRDRDRQPTFCLTAITARADIAVITRLTKVFPRRRCTSIRPSVRPSIRPSLIAFFDKSLTHFGKLF